MRGVVHIAALIVVIGLFLITFVIGAGRYIYLSYQYAASFVGINLNNIASQGYVDWIKTQPNRVESATSAVFLNKELKLPASLAQRELVLGETSVDEGKWIETDLSEQRLYLKENGNTVNSFLVSTGKWSPTPKGEWRIWTKLTSTRMGGGSKALGTYYNLPNVPYTMYYDRGYGIHGAYWHNNFGNTMSHGCTNMKPEEAKIVFDWASVGTRVIVHD